MNVATVRRLAREHRVVAHPQKYHAGRHGLAFVDCLVALERCYAVNRDERHADAWFALAKHTYGRTLRIDFDAHEDQHGHLILIVTAYHT